MGTSVLRLGVSGHQQLGNAATYDFVSQQFRKLLVSFQQRKQDILLYSALAKGADQLFVQIGLDLGIPVEIVIPCAEYETIFTTDAERNEYKRLLSLCQHVHYLPAQACSDDAFLAAGRWIVDHSNLVILAWNGLPPRGRGGTGDIASYARFVKRPFIHINTRYHIVKTYGDLSFHIITPHAVSLKREFAIARQTVYQGPILTVNQYRLRPPNGEEVIRDIVERPESVLIVPIGEQGIVLLVEEYDLGAGTWQLKLPGGKVETATLDGIRQQAQKELRQEIGYKAAKLEKLVDFYSHPGYVSHKVHLFVASDLEWDPLETNAQEEIHVQAYTLKEALDATFIDYRCDPEAALALWMYAHKSASLRYP
jgi:8-oxo-dGTP pyrophosphatase MutT (NUDIX family)